MSKMKIKLVTLTAFLAMTAVTQGVQLKDVKPGFAKNVIFLIPDGSSSTVSTLTRSLYNNG